jgi:hypothetical protein
MFLLPHRPRNRNRLSECPPQSAPHTSLLHRHDACNRAPLGRRPHVPQLRGTHTTLQHLRSATHTLIDLRLRDVSRQSDRDGRIDKGVAYDGPEGGRGACDSGRGVHEPWGDMHWFSELREYRICEFHVVDWEVVCGVFDSREGLRNLRCNIGKRAQNPCSFITVVGRDEGF